MPKNQKNLSKTNQNNKKPKKTFNKLIKTKGAYQKSKIASRRQANALDSRKRFWAGGTWSGVWCGVPKIAAGSGPNSAGLVHVVHGD